MHKNRYIGNAYFSGTTDTTVYYPTIKITAIGTTDYDVVQRVVTYKDGQVLETLAGVCDGRTITVSSGTYTLGNVTTYQDLTTTYTLITGSNVNYKPPVGTKQVIYKLYVHAYGKDPKHAVLKSSSSCC